MRLPTALFRSRATLYRGETNPSLPETFFIPIRNYRHLPVTDREPPGVQRLRRTTDPFTTNLQRKFLAGSFPKVRISNRKNPRHCTPSPDKRGIFAYPVLPFLTGTRTIGSERFTSIVHLPVQSLHGHVQIFLVAMLGSYILSGKKNARISRCNNAE